eukprot:4861338-Prymnesium_polylepis.1
MSGAYALVDDCNPTVYTLSEIAKVTEDCFIECYGSNLMYLPPENFKARKAWADYEDEEDPHLAQPTMGQPTVGGPGYKAPRIPWDPVEDLNSREGVWTEV